MSDNTAILAGYTREIIASAGDIFDLHLFVKPDADLGDVFPAYDADACTFIRVNGWLFSFEDVKP